MCLQNTELYEDLIPAAHNHQCNHLGPLMSICSREQGGKYTGAPGEFAPEMQKRALENQKRAPENRHRH